MGPSPLATRMLNNRIQAAATSTTTGLEFSIWHNYDHAVYLLWSKGSTRYRLLSTTRVEGAHVALE